MKDDQAKLGPIKKQANEAWQVERNKDKKEEDAEARRRAAEEEERAAREAEEEAAEEKRAADREAKRLADIERKAAEKARAITSVTSVTSVTSRGHAPRHPPSSSRLLLPPPRFLLLRYYHPTISPPPISRLPLSTFVARSNLRPVVTSVPLVTSVTSVTSVTPQAEFEARVAAKRSGKSIEPRSGSPTSERLAGSTSHFPPSSPLYVKPDPRSNLVTTSDARFPLNTGLPAVEHTAEEEWTWAQVGRSVVRGGVTDDVTAECVTHCHASIPRL